MNDENWIATTWPRTDLFKQIGSTLYGGRYYNYVEKATINPMGQAPVQGHNFVWQESTRETLSPEAKTLTSWMPWIRWDY